MFKKSGALIVEDHNSQFNHSSHCIKCFHSVFPWPLYCIVLLARLMAYILHIQSLLTCAYFLPHVCLFIMTLVYHCTISTSSLGSNAGSSQIPEQKHKLEMCNDRILVREPCGRMLRGQ